MCIVTITEISQLTSCPCRSCSSPQTRGLCPCALQQSLKSANSPHVSAVVVVAPKQEGLALVHCHAMAAAGAGASFARQVVPLPAIQVQPPQLLCVANKVTHMLAQLQTQQRLLCSTPKSAFYHTCAAGMANLKKNIIPFLKHEVLSGQSCDSHWQGKIMFTRGKHRGESTQTF